MEIFNHETDIDITHKLNKYELKAWLKHLEHLRKEIKSLKRLCSLDLDDGIVDNSIFQQLQEKEMGLGFLIESLENYVQTKPNDLLCEDFQCDLDLMSAHESHRNNYLNFLRHYRKMKNKIYRMVSGKSIEVNNNELKYS